MVPREDFTPFGLVANPGAFARSWHDGSGGTFRATEQRPGFGWLEPWQLRPRRAFGLELGFEQDGRRFLTRADFTAVALTSPYHSANLFEYAWLYGTVSYRVRFSCGGPRTLVARWEVRNDGPDSQPIRAIHVVWAWTSAKEQELYAGVDPPTFASDLDPVLIGRARELPSWGDVAEERLAGQPGRTGRSYHPLELTLRPGDEVGWTQALGRDGEQAAFQAVVEQPAREAALVAEDEEFWATAPQLGGDWPAEFRRGFVYDLETTRLCLQPAGGIFADVWPAWMVNWPRVVLAEGSLDMLRLSFARPDLAKRAVLSLFRDTPGPNVPCVFKHGEPNMVATDGAVCGTSPAWCVPFHNLRQLYLRTLDRAWLAQLYPHLAAYVRWWVEHRSDSDGWTVYKCTWEAGEDNSTRLDPAGEGDHVISQYARPIELQASMAHAAATLRFFAAELGRAGDGPWSGLERAALARVHRLWDAAEGRFRDLDSRRDAFIEPAGRNDYWGTDPRRFSALALTPLLFGQTDREQEAALRREIEHYDRPPWCDWPSWSYIVLEAASRAGWYDFAGQMAYGICRRVYAENDRRDLATWERPLPGVAREYWPSDLATWDASEGYGWGATTASYVVRQLCGFYESEATTACAFRLAPAFPDELIAGRALAIGPIPYRGRLLWLRYRDIDQAALELELRLDRPERLRVQDGARGHLLLNAAPASEHRFRVARARPLRVEVGSPGASPTSTTSWGA